MKLRHHFSMHFDCKKKMKLKHNHLWIVSWNGNQNWEIQKQARLCCSPSLYLVGSVLFTLPVFDGVCVVHPLCIWWGLCCSPTKYREDEHSCPQSLKDDEPSTSFYKLKIDLSCAFIQLDFTIMFIVAWCSSKNIIEPLICWVIIAIRNE
jgi:hypothetical protein